jgi:hypothetical protein
MLPFFNPYINAFCVSHRFTINFSVYFTLKTANQPT